MNTAKLKKVVKTMQERQLTLKELKLTISDIIFLKDNGYRVKYHYDPRVKDYVYYITPRDDMAYIVISELEEKENKLNILQISDLHAGSNKFDEESLHKTLKEAVKRKVKYVHVSGDILDGHNMYRGHEVNLKYHTAEEQVELIYSIFRKYNLWYIISLGNHDASFSKNGELDPLRMLEAKMAADRKKLTYLEAYEANIVHLGVVFRLIHLNGGQARSKSYKPQVYLSNVFDSNVNDVLLGNKTYNIRSVQCGHFHVRYNFEIGGVTLTMPGNFQFDGDLTKRMGITGKTGGIFEEIIIYNGQIIEEKTEFF